MPHDRLRAKIAQIVLLVIEYFTNESSAIETIIEAHTLKDNIKIEEIGGGGGIYKIRHLNSYSFGKRNSHASYMVHPCDFDLFYLFF